MKSKEIIAEMDMDTYFDDMCSKRKAMFIGSFTDIIGKFHDEGLVVENPGFNCMVRVHGSDYDLVNQAAEAFSEHFDITDVKDIGQSRGGFKLHIGHLTVGAYIKHLKDLYRQLF